MALKDFLSDDAFLALPEEQQVDALRQNSEEFAGAWGRSQEKTLAWLRKKTKKPEAETSPVGEVIRQFGSGLGEAATNIAALPFDTAEWVASKAGSEWSTGVDDAIEKFAAHAFPEPETAAGRIARATGEGLGYGVAVAATGGALGTAGAFARVASLGKAAKGLTKTGQILSGGLGVEAAAGSVGGAAAAGTAEFTDNPWLVAGAGILAGGITGIGIAARGAAVRRARSEGQPGETPAGVPRSPAEQAARDAAENITTDEVKQLGIADVLDQAGEFDAQKTLEGFTAGIHASMDQNQLKIITSASARVFEEAGFTFNPAHTLTSQLAHIIKSGRMSKAQVNGILEGFGTSVEEVMSDELADAFQMTVRQSARSLNVMSQMRKKLKASAAAKKRQMGRDLTDEEATALKEVGGPNGEGLSFWRRLENVRRGLLVTQVATAMRNFETQVANLGVHTLEDAMEAGILKVFPERIQQAHPTNVLGPLSRLMGSFNPFKKSKSFDQVQELQQFFKQEIDPLFARYSSDIEGGIGTGPVGGLEKATLMLNSANRLQEFAIRRAVFTSELDRILGANGRSLEQMSKANLLGSLPREDIQGAVRRALEMTWGSEFHSGMDGVKGIAGNFIDFVNRAGVGPFRLTQVMPFPRFMANSIRWQYQHSPLPLMKQLMSPSGWKSLRNGDVKPLVKATTGTGMFLVAHQIRMSQPADTKWYQIEPSAEVAEALGMQPGATVDLRPFNPFASFLFAADVVKRVQDGTLQNFTTRDVVMGLMATNLRAGAGMYVLDEFLDKISQGFQNFKTPEDKAAAFKMIGTGAAEYAGAAWSGALVPFQQLRDITQSFDALGGDPSLRDQGAEPGQGAFKRKLPFADENLPEVELPTRGAAPQTGAPADTGIAKYLGFGAGDPLGRQLTGFTARGAKNAGERELDRMGFTRGSILPSSGDDTWDRTRAKHMGPIFEQIITPWVESDNYKNMSDELKNVMMEKMLDKVRRIATAKAAGERPELYRKSREGRMSKRKRNLKRSLQDRSERLEEQRREMQ